MRPHDLTSLRASYGTATVSLETFATLAGTASPVWLRMRRQRDDTFPPALRAGSRPGYTLASLIDWYERSGASRGSIGEAVADQAAVQAWALHEAVAGAVNATASSPAAARGTTPEPAAGDPESLEEPRIRPATPAEATFGQLAAAALLVADGVAFPELENPDADADWIPLAHRWHELPRRSKAPAQDLTALPAGFVPDPDPVGDPAVMGRLTRGLPGERWGAAQRRAERALVEEVARTWDIIGREDPLTFRRLIEQQATRLLSRVDAAREVTSPETAKRLVQLAGIEPGDIVLDPALGEGATLIRAVEDTRDVEHRQTIGVVGRESDRYVWLHAKLRFGLRRIAHDLGRPGDSLKPGRVTGTYRRIVAEPGARRRESVEWARFISDRLAVGGTAAIAFDDAVVIPPYEPARMTRRGASPWRDVAAVFSTPENAREKKAQAVVVMHQAPLRSRRTSPGNGVLCVDIEPSTRHAARRGESADAIFDRQTALGIALVRQHLDGIRLQDGTRDGVTWLTLPAFTQEFVWRRNTLSGTTVEDGSTAGQGELPLTMSPAGDRPDVAAVLPGDTGPARADIDRVLAEAIEAAETLRWFIEADPEVDGKPEQPGRSEETAGILASDATDEMRRGLRRLHILLTELQGDRRTNRPEDGRTR